VEKLGRSEEAATYSGERHCIEPHRSRPEVVDHVGEIDDHDPWRSIRRVEPVQYRLAALEVGEVNPPLRLSVRPDDIARFEADARPWR
jgi:hypothetical protein